MSHAPLTPLLTIHLAWSLQVANTHGDPLRSLYENVVWFALSLAFFVLLSAVAVLFLTLAFGIFAVPPVAFVQWLYGGAVKRWMSRPGGAAAAAREAPEPAPSSRPPVALRFEVHEPDKARTTEVTPLHRKAEAASRAVTRVYVAAGAVYAAAMTPLAAYVYFLYHQRPAAAPDSIPASFYLITFASLLWLPLLVFLVAAVGRRLWKLAVVGAYVLLMAALTFLLRDEPVAPLWVVLTSAPTAVMFVLRFSGVAGLAFATALSLIAAAFPVLNGLVGFSKTGPVPGWHRYAILAAVAGSALLAVLLLWWVSHLYARRRTSEQILLLDGFWLSATFILSAFAAVPAGMYALLGLVPFALYKLTAWAGLRWLEDGRQSGGELRLLLLRVFGAKRRSEWLLKRLGHHWRYAGCIQLIAAPDLAAANLELDELLAFVAGRLRRRFIKDARDGAARVASLDARPDPDGRYRVQEFFCHDDAWQGTVAALTRHSDAVLMDLRGFTAQRRGCVTEIFHLLDAVPVNRLVLLINKDTEEEYLKQTLEDAWAAMSDASPNRGLRAPVLRLLRIRRQNARAVRHLLWLLWEATQASHAPAAAVTPAHAARPQRAAL